MKKPIVKVLIGIAGSGKTTLREEILSVQKVKKFRVISADQVRFKMLDFEKTGRDFDPKIEPEVWKEVWTQYENALRDRRNIIFDATNLTLMRRYPIVARARKSGYWIDFIFNNCPFHLILQRNKRRKRNIAVKILMKQYLSLQYPEVWEFDNLTIINQENYRPSITTAEALSKLNNKGWEAMKNG